MELNQAYKTRGLYVYTLMFINFTLYVHIFIQCIVNIYILVRIYVYVEGKYTF